jgi:hypothetical protein
MDDRRHNHVCQCLFFLDIAEADDADEAVPEDPLISLHAIAGIRLGEMMQVRINLSGASLLALLDSGLTHNFVVEEVAARTSLYLQLRGGLRVTVANGERVPCPGVYHVAFFSIEGTHFSTDFFTLLLADYDVMMGTQWLASLGPSSRTLTR